MISGQRVQSVKGSEQETCAFCNLDPDRIIAANDYAFTMLDGFPISPGHTLIIPRRHIGSLFEATEKELSAMFALLAEMREQSQRERRPAGFNIGINEGEAAGQTVMHLHIHLIPRYTGDMKDPRGGIRWLFPDKAVYWEK